MGSGPDKTYLKFGTFTTDVDDSELTFSVSATTNEDKISILPSTYTSSDSSDSVLFLPDKLWSQEATIQVIATDNHEEDEKSDTATFILDVLRVPRPEINVAVVQNNAFSNYLSINDFSNDKLFNEYKTYLALPVLEKSFLKD